MSVYRRPSASVRRLITSPGCQPQIALRNKRKVANRVAARRHRLKAEGVAVTLAAVAVDRVAALPRLLLAAAAVTQVVRRAVRNPAGEALL